jgi:hypothetical protein
MAMKKLLIFLLLLNGAAPAAALPPAAQQAVEQALRARGVKDAPGLRLAAEEAYRQGASGAELKAFLEQAPAPAPALELEKGLKDMAGLLREGLDDREARKAALKALRARLNAAGSVRPGAAASGSDGALRQSQSERREETRRRLGGRRDADPGPTPAVR